MDMLSEKELKALLRTAYDLVLAKLPKKARAGLGSKGAPKKTKPRH